MNRGLATETYPLIILREYVDDLLRFDQCRLRSEPGIMQFIAQERFAVGLRGLGRQKLGFPEDVPQQLNRGWKHSGQWAESVVPLFQSGICR